MDPSEMVICPYNFSHVILKIRMPGHLIKCRQQHPTNDFSICPFNSTHDVPTPELQYHTEVCEDRKKLDSFIYATDKVEPIHFDNVNIPIPDSSENWDEEPTENSYLDVKNKLLTDKEVIRLPVGMSKTKRKAFFQEEVQRFENMSTASNSERSSKVSDSKSSSSLSSKNQKKKIANPRG